MTTNQNEVWPNPNNKPIVEFYIGKAIGVREGGNALVQVKKHYGNWINGTEVDTSTIVQLYDNGSFETLNTLYVPINE